MHARPFSEPAWKINRAPTYTGSQHLAVVDEFDHSCGKSLANIMRSRSDTFIPDPQGESADIFVELVKQIDGVDDHVVRVMNFELHIIVSQLLCMKQYLHRNTGLFSTEILDHFLNIISHPAYALCRYIEYLSLQTEN